MKTNLLAFGIMTLLLSGVAIGSFLGIGATALPCPTAICTSTTIMSTTTIPCPTVICTSTSTSTTSLNTTTILPCPTAACIAENSTTTTIIPNQNTEPMRTNSNGGLPDWFGECMFTRGESVLYYNVSTGTVWKAYCKTYTQHNMREQLI